jgi:hypothetical protein
MSCILAPHQGVSHWEVVVSCLEEGLHVVSLWVFFIVCCCLLLFVVGFSSSTTIMLYWLERREFESGVGDLVPCFSDVKFGFFFYRLVLAMATIFKPIKVLALSLAVP